MPVSPEVSAAIHAVWAKVHSVKGLSFPQTGHELTAIGVTRYHVDYVAGTATAYVGDDADVFAIPTHGVPAAKADAAALSTAIRAAQAGTIGNYSDFGRAVVAAGVTDYTAYLAGGNVVYGGVMGHIHAEPFPPFRK